MELYVLAVIVIVFLASFFSLLFISKLPRGKTFDEVLAEKRQAAEKLYGTSGHKTVRQKPKKINSSKKTTKPKTREPKEVELETVDEIESDTQSDGDVIINNSPSHVKGHVEFSDAEIISENESIKKPVVTKSNIPQKRKNSKSSGTGILVNKNEPISIKSPETTETLNHFEEIHPKDDVEKVKSHQKDDESKNNNNKNDKVVNKEQKKGKNKKDAHTAAETTSAEVLGNAKEEKIIAVGKFQENVPFNHGHVKEKMNKKKKTEFDLVQKLIDEREGISVNFLIPLLSKAELTRSEIQILIDFLLNKQQDTITVDHSEWSEGRSDIVLKLKKQLSEKERAFKDEQEATIAIQAKLREMRVEINTERAQFNANIKAQAEEIHQKKLEVQNLTSEIQYISDKFNAEKQTLSVQLQQLQSKLIQEKKTNTQEFVQQIQQLTENNNSLANDLVSKNSLINELKNMGEETFLKLKEYEKKCADYEQLAMQLQLLSDKNMYLEQEITNYRQRTQDFASREADISGFQNEIHKLRSELSARNEDYEKFYLSKQFEVDKLKSQLAEQTSLMDANKVEIRNFQNELDSSRKELNESHTELLDYKALTDNLNSEIRDLKLKITNFTVENSEQTKQVSELHNIVCNFKTALADKESKVSYYEIQAKSFANKEDELFKQIEEHKGKNNANVVDPNKILQDEQSRTKEMFKTIFPDLPDGPSQYDKWIEHLCLFIKQQLIINQNQNNIIGEKTNDNCNNITKEITTITTTTSNDNNDNDDETLLKNANLVSTLNTYKKMMTETELLLSNVEKESQEREIYWQNIVDNKNAEIETLKINNTAQTT